MVVFLSSAFADYPGSRSDQYFSDKLNLLENKLEGYNHQFGQYPSSLDILKTSGVTSPDEYGYFQDLIGNKNFIFQRDQVRNAYRACILSQDQNRPDLTTLSGKAATHGNR